MKNAKAFYSIYIWWVSLVKTQHHLYIIYDSIRSSTRNMNTIGFQLHAFLKCRISYSVVPIRYVLQNISPKYVENNMENFPKCLYIYSHLIRMPFIFVPATALALFLFFFSSRLPVT